MVIIIFIRLFHISTFTKFLFSFQDQLEISEATIDTLNSMLDILPGKKDDRQGITRNNDPTINRHYSDARFYVSGALHALGETEKKLIEKYESELEIALGKVNDYYKGDRMKVRSELEKVSIPKFKDYEEIR